MKAPTALALASAVGTERTDEVNAIKARRAVALNCMFWSFFEMILLVFCESFEDESLQDEGSQEEKGAGIYTSVFPFTALSLLSTE